MNAIVIYWSATGNTEKVALSIHNALMEKSINSKLMQVKEAANEDFFNYDIVFLGAPTYMWSPPDEMCEFVKKKMKEYNAQGRVKIGAPKVPGKRAVVFITYTGTHTGLREAIPAGKWLGTFFEHLGFTMEDEWYVIGEYHGQEDRSTLGRMGDVRGRPSQQDLDDIAQKVRGLLRSIGA
jgi:flavodoxin